ncbi:MAG: carbohydrate kinase family protein [Acidobacteriaceae bacterium]
MMNAQLSGAKVDLVGVGLNATDTVIPLTTFPTLGSKTEYSESSILLGGEVSTAVIACRRWGLRTRYVGRLGLDYAARLHRAAFDDVGVETHIVTVEDASSPQSIILVDGAGERTVLCHRDPRLTLQPEDLQREWIISARALLVDGYHTTAAIAAATWAREEGIPVVADLDVLRPGIDELLPLVDYAFASREFPLALTGEPDLRKALTMIHEQFHCRLAGVTLGLGGVLTWDGERSIQRHAYRVSTVDTTGAGDLFHAGFAYGHLQGWPIELQLDYACAAAALNCTRAGARGRIGTVGEISRVMADNTRYDIAECAESL